MRSVRARVTGRVQGVGFRWNTMREAERRGVRGWVRNHPDGSVEAHLEGEGGAVDALIEWLHHGPSGARVDRVEGNEVEPEGHEGFEIIR